MPESDEMNTPPPLDAGPQRVAAPRANQGYREVTVAAVVFAIVVGVIMNASITYAGLKIGFTIVGSAIAAVLGFGVLRGFARLFVPGAGTVVETNIAQTAASAVNTSNSGVIFTVPVLFLIGFTLTWDGADFWLITLACIAGAILGCAFIIPLRKQMIDIDRLRFPSGTGVAVILKSPGAGVKKTLVLLAGILLSAAIYAPSGLPAISTPVAAEEIVGDEQRSLAQLVEAADSDGPDTFDALDRLVFAERLSADDAQHTRDMEQWIGERSAPDELLVRGEAALLVRERTAAMQEAKDALKQRPLPEGAREALAAAKADLVEAEDAITALDDDYADLSEDSVIAITRAASGEMEWDALRNTKFGWAGDPLFGYQDLQARLPAYYERDGELHPRVDRDENGRPDLVITDSTVDVGRWFQLPDEYQLVFAIAPFALGAGFITGRAGLMVLAGGILAYFVLNPVAYAFGWLPETTKAHEAPGVAFTSFNRPLGIGMLLGGALMGVIASLPSIAAALGSIARVGKSKRPGGRDELGLTPLVVAMIAAVGLLFLAADFVGTKALNAEGICPVTAEQVTAEADPVQYRGYGIAFSTQEAADTWSSGGTYEGVTWTSEAKNTYLESMNAKPGWLADLDPHLRALIIALIGAVWIWFAGVIIAQCTGMTDWSPISGMALLTVVLVLLLAGSGAVVGAVLIGAALCVAITLGADMMADLRTGHLVGAKPAKQQMTELALVGLGPIVCMLTILIIANVNLQQTGVAFGPGTPTSAPQAQALQAVITGVQGGDLPYVLYGLGAVLGALLGLGSFAGLGVLVGLSVYLPFMFIATYGIGCVANMLLTAMKGKRWTEEWGVPFAAGLIVGESILSLIINIYVLATG
ncbi:MAG: OPT/YSL family transporter [Planctomycetota bacterium]